MTTCRWNHIIWDWNGTLLNDVRLCVEIINQLLIRYRLPQVNIESYQRMLDFPIKEYYRRLGFDFEKTPFETVGTEFIEIYQSRWRECLLQAGALSALNRFRDMGIAQSVLSASEIRFLEQSTGYFGISSYFSHRIGLNHHYATGKLGIGRKFLEQLGHPPETVLLIGDTAHDFQVASALGLQCLLLSCGHHPKEKLKPLGAPILDSLDRLPSWLNKNRNL